MENNIEPGDVVALKSGGPEMTVEGQVTDGGVVCSWFAGGQLKRHTFASGALRFINRTKLRKAEVKPQ